MLCQGMIIGVSGSSRICGVNIILNTIFHGRSYATLIKCGRRSFMFFGPAYQEDQCLLFFHVSCMYQGCSLLCGVLEKEHLGM